MTVSELTREELNELKESYYEQLLFDDEEILWPLNHITPLDIESPEDIPDDIIYHHYAEVTFDPDDFSVTDKEG